ncbi:MAG: DHA2 family efflux MFS transporter permease subunit [Chloroflexota bacterium]|nr:DHA2 family efflux MFS transporter permease subunit [Chloroflexota bacterium]
MAVAQQGVRDRRYEWLVLLTVMTGSFMSTMDSSIANLSLPVLSQIFQEGPAVVLWVSLVYILTLSGLMLTAGRMGDLLGRKRVYASGFAIFSLGLVLCSLAQNMPQLILFRVVQAAGGALTTGLGPALITTTFPPEERGRALGIWGMSIGAGLGSGPALGGVLLNTLGWRSIFWARLPLSVAGAVVAWTMLRESRPVTSQPRFDIWGALFLFGGVASLLVGVNQGQVRGWTSAFVLALGATSLVLLTSFLVVERRTPQPVVDLALFRSRPFATATVTQFFYYASYVGVSFLMPFYLIRGRGLPPLSSGLLLTIVAVAMGLLSPLAGRLCDRIGHRVLVAVGIGLSILGLFLLRGLGPSATPLEIGLDLLVLGVGAGFFMTPNYSAIMGSVPADRLGTASAMISTPRALGQAAGLALIGVVLVWRELHYSAWLAQEGWQGEALASRALIGGFADALWVSILAGFLGLGVALLGEGGRPAGRR